MRAVPYDTNGRIYSPRDIEEVLGASVNEANIQGNNKGVRYFNVPCAFDIEVSSFYRDADGNAYTYEQSQRITDADGGRVKLEKCAVMYVWQFGINGRIVMGRTWDEFTGMCAVISRALGLCDKRRLLVYVHNLSYEFQFLRSRFGWYKVFSIDLRKPIYAITDGFIEFRCSYLLSGYSLAKLGDQLMKYRCAKKTGDLDYSLIRHSLTPLTVRETGYCVNDIIVVMSYIQERIDESGGLKNIPITKTGFVRNHCRKCCLRTEAGGKSVPNWDYVRLMGELTISGLDEFDALQRAFAGGFTHANAIYADEVVYGVSSYDFTSSYPYVMVSEKFPMSRGVEVRVKSVKQFDFYVSKYLAVFDIEFTDITAKQMQDNPISASKCFVKERYAENNGRIVSAGRICTTITSVDYKVIGMFYTWKSVRIGRMYCYRPDYLPTELVTAILGLYAAKTTLKGVRGKEAEYFNSKELLNSCYGMCVTNPLRDEFTYNGVWDVTHMTGEMRREILDKYNRSANRFLFYPWGVFVTAYARRNLFTAIYECGNDYVYSDTDSVKIRNADAHRVYFAQYNETAVRKLREAMTHHGLPFGLVEPETADGITKTLGLWDYEGVYDKFKTLGAKRYMVARGDALTVGGRSYPVSLTVSGIDKGTAVPYLLGKYGEDGIFGAFTDYLCIPPEATGKNIHTYVDYRITGAVTDYKGETAPFDEYTGVHLEPTGYSLSLSVMYLNYLRGIKFEDR